MNWLTFSAALWNTSITFSLSLSHPKDTTFQNEFSVSTSQKRWEHRKVKLLALAVYFFPWKLFISKRKKGTSNKTIQWNPAVWHPTDTGFLIDNNCFFKYIWDSSNIKIAMQKYGWSTPGKFYKERFFFLYAKNISFSLRAWKRRSLFPFEILIPALKRIWRDTKYFESLCLVAIKIFTKLEHALIA